VIDLRRDCERIEQAWAGSRTSWLPLSMAAAFTFHQTRRDVANLLTQDEYASALDIAAAALSRIIPIYTPDGRGVPVPVAANLASQKFCGGATRLQCADGPVVAPLSVVRIDVLPALVAIDRSRIDYVAPARVMTRERRPPASRRV